LPDTDPGFYVRAFVLLVTQADRRL